MNGFPNFWIQYHTSWKKEFLRKTSYLTLKMYEDLMKNLTDLIRISSFFKLVDVCLISSRKKI